MAHHHSHSQDQQPAPRDSIEILPAADLWARFVLVDTLGEGQYGVVWRCQERATGRVFACKHIKLAGLGEKGLRAAVREIEVMALLHGQRNCVALHSIFEDDESVYVLMECATGGDLLARIQRAPGGRIAEPESRQIFGDVARAVKQCHDSGVVHRDIKPENILLCEQQSPATNATTGGSDSNPSSPKRPFASLPLNALRSRPKSAEPSATAAAPAAVTAKLADFGLSLALRPGQQVVGYAGSFPYEAPEVLAQKPYDHSADVFSLGVTLYAMLSGTWPAFHKSRTLDDLVDWQLPCWQHVSELAKDLIRWMLAPHAHMRPSIDEVLAHPWFSLPQHVLQLQAGARNLVRNIRAGARYWGVGVGIGGGNSGRRPSGGAAAERDAQRQLAPEPEEARKEAAPAPTSKRQPRRAPAASAAVCKQQLDQNVNIVGFGGQMLSVR